jgi:hypothetical protein
LEDLVEEVEVKSLCLTKHHAMKAYWGVEVQLNAFFDLSTMSEQLHGPGALRPAKQPWYALERGVSSY